MLRDSLSAAIVGASGGGRLFLGDRNRPNDPALAREYRCSRTPEGREMDSKFPLSSVLTASSLRDLILANRDCTIGLTSVSLEGSADFTNSYTLATLAAWVRRVRPNANLLYASEVD